MPVKLNNFVCVYFKPDQLNALNVVHVSGTKGKGSTCAFVESILRRHGYKTGFYRLVKSLIES